MEHCMQVWLFSPLRLMFYIKVQ
uniref:Uncharacterized protein n=1 Tax=Anguilla anguilla TaxID=7936 RepID=A0A0E9S749_ANGAN